ncbi:hypothetical protein CRG98_008557 [Punica granatum]|uniref:non-specific serine/threonine protein kinase n=1 Tax=Punica granatum TaxID=22663 RepID=A0A2I0KT01_PUNGR|nr:hypothetical protein CRG98_008557 [Punica granatum]
MERMGSVWFLLELAMCSAMVGMLVSVHGQDQNPAGFISIDCGAPNDYPDNRLRIHYKTDEEFIDSGKNAQISTDVIYDYKQSQSKNLRFFPTGSRNCYTLRPDQGKGNTYLIRASFYYGNYDNRNKTPAFDLHIGTDYWITVNSSDYHYKEIIHVPTTDTIQVCLINTGNGSPFISSLELRLVDSSIYQLSNLTSLSNAWRYDIGSSSDTTYRHPQDVYDRMWSGNSYDYVTINSTSTTGLSNNNDAYKVPAEVLKTAQKATDVNPYIYVSWSSNSTDEWCFYFHFAEIERLPTGQRREFTISVSDRLMDTVTLEYLKPVTVASQIVTGPKINFSIDATQQSGQHLPILNAIEIFTIVKHLNVPTAMDDITAINDIKKAYSINGSSWQGDPCVPADFIWKGLECSHDNPPRIVSLDLSGSQLTGPVPEFLAKLPNLKFLNLSGNKLNGSIPESLQKKVDDQILQLRMEGNPDLCKKGLCKPKKKGKSILFTVIASASGSIVAMLMALAIVWRIKTTKRKGAQTTQPIKSKYRPFMYSEVLKITDNFKNVIGEGGFGKVYLGALASDTKVAIKLLSRTSKQGCKEFQAEAQLLMIVHHRNLVSLVGYCDDSEHMALIYEFMANGNLRKQLSNQSRGTHILTWRERLRIAIDVAQGLDYLHNGCKPPIVHRDLKTTNILLNESLQAKIADFGLSKAFAADNDTYISTQPAGTPGFHSSGNLNRKSDVYSFGVILLELITGYPAVIKNADETMHVLHWVTPIVQRGDIQSIVDSQLDGEFNVNSAWKLLEVAMQCASTTAIQRPDISRVLAELKECWDIEMGLERSQRMGSSKIRSANSFEMTSTEIECDSLPDAR